jgi:hypothetical protein
MVDAEKPQRLNGKGWIPWVWPEDQTSTTEQPMVQLERLPDDDAKAKPSERDDPNTVASFRVIDWEHARSVSRTTEEDLSKSIRHVRIHRDGSATSDAPLTPRRMTMFDWACLQPIPDPPGLMPNFRGWGDPRSKETWPTEQPATCSKRDGRSPRSCSEPSRFGTGESPHPGHLCC